MQRVAHHLHPARRDAVLVAVVELRRHRLSRAGRTARRPPGRRGGPRRASPSAVGISQPFSPSYHSSHQPSRIDRFSPPLSALFIPDVPHASSGRSGLFSQTSQPAVQLAGHRHVVVGQERDAVPHLRAVGELHHLLDQRLAAVVGGVRLARHDQLNRALLRRAAASPAGPGRAASASAACTSAPAGRTRWSTRRDRKPLRSSPIRRPTRHAPATSGVAGPARPRRGPCRNCERIHHMCPVSTCCSRCHVSGSLSEPRSSLPSSSRPSSSHCGAAHVGPCTPLVIEPIGTSLGSNPGHSSLNMCAADPPVQQRHPVGALREPQAHVGHVELRRVVLGAERDDRGPAVRRAAAATSRPTGRPSSRRSTA